MKKYYVVCPTTRMYATEKGWTDNIKEAFLCENQKDAQYWIDWNFEHPKEFAVMVWKQ